MSWPPASTLNLSAGHETKLYIYLALHPDATNRDIVEHIYGREYNQERHAKLARTVDVVRSRLNVKLKEHGIKIQRIRYAPTYSLKRINHDQPTPTSTI